MFFFVHYNIKTEYWWNSLSVSWRSLWSVWILISHSLLSSTSVFSISVLDIVLAPFNIPETKADEESTNPFFAKKNTSRRTDTSVDIKKGDFPTEASRHFLRFLSLRAAQVMCFLISDSPPMLVSFGALGEICVVAVGDLGLFEKAPTRAFGHLVFMEESNANWSHWKDVLEIGFVLVDGDVGNLFSWDKSSGNGGGGGGGGVEVVLSFSSVFTFLRFRGGDGGNGSIGVGSVERTSRPSVLGMSTMVYPTHFCSFFCMCSGSSLGRSPLNP